MKLAFGLSNIAMVLVVGTLIYLILEKKNEPLPVTQTTTMFTLTSPVFAEGGSIPAPYTCDGENKNPELQWSGIPEGTKSFVLIVDDPDIPAFVKERMGIEVFDHFVLFNIPFTTPQIMEDSVPEGAVQGKNSAGKSGYTGPCPPDGEHRYFFKLYALNTMLELGEEATKADIEKAMEGHVLETATLQGRYARLPE